MKIKMEFASVILRIFLRLYLMQGWPPGILTKYSTLASSSHTGFDLKEPHSLKIAVVRSLQSRLLAAAA